MSDDNATPTPPASEAGTEPEAAIPLPPAAAAPPAVDAERTAIRQRHLWRLDVLLAGLVLLLGFLLASFAIQTPRFWLHLATGRYLAGDLSGIGTDPFCHTTAGVLWVNHSWLFDLLIYGLYTLVDGAGLVILKALLITVLVLVLLQLRQDRPHLWLAVLSTTLVLLACSPYLLFSPALVSMLFLVLTLRLLFLPPEVPRWRLWLLVPLFLLWVNLDEWFVLGPLTVGLFLVGQGLARLTAPTAAAVPGREPALRSLLLLFVASVAVCLVNPYLYQAWQLPPELAYLVWTTSPVLPREMLAGGITLQEIAQHDPLFLQNFGYWQSPLAVDFLYPQGRLFLPALAYWLLLLGGLISFLSLLVMDRNKPGPFSVWSRLLLWLFFATLSLCQARLIPFFVLVGGPLMVLNWEDVWRPAEAAAHRRLPWALPLLGRLAGLASLLVLLLLSWPGWLQGHWGSGRSPYRVAWEVTADASLQQAAAEQAQRHAAGKIHNGFNYNPDAACYCAWFCPQVKSYYDFRFALFAGQGETIGKLRWMLRQPAGPATQELVQQLQRYTSMQEKLFVRQDITHVLWTGIDRDMRVYDWVLDLLHLSHRWTLLWGDGQSVICRWWPRGLRDREAQAASMQMNFTQLALDPRQIPLDADSLAFPRPPEWWQYFLFPAPSAHREIAEARFYLACNDSLRQRRNFLFAALFRAPQQSLFRLAAASNSFPARLAASLAENLARQEYLVPPGLSLLAVQAARRGQLANPDDANVYRLLAGSYTLLQGREEDYWLRSLPSSPSLRDDMRRIQRTTAWQLAIQLDPEDYRSHWALAETFLQLNYPDLGLRHMQLAEEGVKKSHLPEPILEQQLQVTKKERELALRNLTEQVKQRREHFLLHTEGKPLIEKLHFALEGTMRLVTPQGEKKITKLGLAGEVLQLLKQTPLQSLNEKDKLFVSAVSLQLNTNLGKMENVAELLQDPWIKEFVPRLSLLHYTGQLAAAMGNAVLFDRVIGEVEEAVRDNLGRSVPLLVPLELIGPVTPWPFVAAALEVRDLLQEDVLYPQLREQIALRTTRGLILLETGDITKAAERFREALSLIPAGVVIPEAELARRYLYWMELAP